MTAFPAHKKEYSLRIEEQEPGDVVLFISGRLALEELNKFISDARSILENKLPKKLDLNLGGVTYLDSAGTLVLSQLEKEYTLQSIPVTFQDVTDQIKGMLNLLSEKVDNRAASFPQRKKPNILEQVGEVTLRFIDDFYQTMSFAGELLIALINALLSPRSVRWQDVLFYVKRAGVDGLPIVGLISLLMGLIMAFCPLCSLGCLELTSTWLPSWPLPW